MMKSGSQPPLRNIQTARIKDGRQSFQYLPTKDIKANLVKKQSYHNPENQQQSPKKQCYHRNFNKIINNSSDKYDYIQTEADSPVKRIADIEAPKITKYQTNKQETIAGRKLQYPIANVQRNIPQNNSKKAQMRPKSAIVSSKSTEHFIDRSAKSRLIKQKSQQEGNKIKVVMNYLLQNNDSYLAQRSRICNQKARPKQQIFKIDLAKSISTYKNHYPPKSAQLDFEIEPQNQKMSLLIPPEKVCGNSTSIQFHNGERGPKADLATWPQGFKLQGPLDSTTTYANKFPNYGQYQKMVPIATFNEHPMGMTFNTTSTHRQHFKGEPYPRAQLANWNNMHPYGNDFDPNRSTTYRSAHNSKQKGPIQSWPMYDPRLIISKGKFSTQYKSEHKNFNDHQLHIQNKCKCGHCKRRPVKHIYN